MKRFRIPFVILFAAVCVLFALRAFAQQGDRVYSFVMISENDKITGADDLAKQVIELVFKKIGEKVQVSFMPHDKAIREANAKKIDFLYLTHSDYVSMSARGVRMTPILTMAPRGHLKEYRCLVVSKNIPWSGMESIRGKRYIRPWNEGDYYGARWFLQAGGVDQPLDKFFSSFVDVIDERAAIQAVSENKADAVIVSGGSLNVQKFINNSVLRKVNVAECRELPWPSAPIVWFGNPDPKKLKKFYDLLANFNPETEPEFARFKPIMKIVQMQLVLVAQKDYAELSKVFGAAKKKGWTDEFKRVAK